MATAYFDSSAFVKLVVDEPGSDVAARLWDEVDVVVSSRLANPEVRAALAAARRAGRLTDEGELRVRTDWAEHWSATRIVELTEHVGASAASLTAELVLGGADAVHLASALILAGAAPVMVAWDVRLRTAAAAAGLAIAPAAV